MLGILFAIVAMFTTAIEVVFTRYAMLEWDVKPTIFILWALFISSYIQISIAGYSHGGWFVRSLRQAHTWFYTLCQVIMNICGLFVLYYITTTEAFFLQRFSIIAAVVMAWIVLNRKPQYKDWPAIAIILGALGYILSHLDPNSIGVVTFLLVIAGFCNAGRTIVSETHPTYLQAGNIFNRLRVTGIIMLLTSLTMIIVMLGAAIAKPHLAEFPLVSVLPDLASFRHAPTFMFALFVGAIILPLDIYANFRAAALMNTERLLMTKAALPFVVLAIEWPVSLFSEKMSIGSISIGDYLAGLAIVMAGLMMMLGRRHSSESIVVPIEFGSDDADHDINQAESDLDRIQHAFEQFEGDTAKVSKALGIPGADLERLRVDPDIRLTGEASRKMRDNFTSNIAYIDGLTLLMNKVHFLSLVRETVHKSERASVVYLDLDGFKPINDTYGHAIGDETLRIVGMRLKSVAKTFNAQAARLGGDEFAMLLPGGTPQQAGKLKKAIETKLGNPIRIDGIDDKPQIGVSVGVSQFPKDAQEAKRLLDIADDNMYAIKKSSKRQRN